MVLHPPRAFRAVNVPFRVYRYAFRKVVLAGQAPARYPDKRIHVAIDAADAMPRR